jgi:hypothetical protein
MLALLALIGLSVYRYGNNWLNSDHSSEMVLSKLLSQENKLVTSSWKYSTEIRLVYQQIFMMPLFKLFDDWRMIRTITVLLNNILLVASYFFMMKQLKIAAKWTLLTSYFLLFPINAVYWDIVTFGGYYVFFLAMFFCCMGLFFRLLNGIGGKGAFVLFCIISIVLGTGGIRALMDIQVPLFIAGICAYRFSPAKKETSPPVLSIVSLVLCGVGFMVNIILHIFFQFHSYSGMNVSALREEFFQKLGSILFEFIAYFGYTENSKLLSPNGLFSLLSLALLGFLFVCAVRIVRRYYKTEKTSSGNILSSAEVFICLFFTVSSIFHIAIFQFLDGDITLRYFIPFLFLYIPVLAVIFKYTAKKLPPIKATSVSAFITMIVMVQGAIKFQEIVPADWTSARSGYIQYIEEHNLSYGFATFWNANVTTELSNGKIEMAGLNPDNIHTLHNWLSPTAYENPDYHKGKTFLLLTKDEAETYNKEPLLQGPPDYADDDFVVWRFPSATTIFNGLIVETK